MERTGKVVLLSYHLVTCPCCRKEIYVPEFRQQPITVEDYQRFNRDLAKRVKKHV